MKDQLCPSILSADFNHLGEQLHILEDAGVEMLHIDVMDGMFVPSISFGMPVIRSIRKECGMLFDVHLMIEKPERYIEEFVSCGADSITIHAEATEDPKAVLAQIHAAGVKAGLSIKPHTPVASIRELLPDADFILVMTVEPGFGGQKYIDYCSDKVRELRTILAEEGLERDIQVDGGINEETTRTAMEAGANWLVMGSSVFNGDVKANTEKYLRLMKEVRN